MSPEISALFLVLGEKIATLVREAKAREEALTSAISISKRIERSEYEARKKIDELEGEARTLRMQVEEQAKRLHLLSTPTKAKARSSRR